MPSCPADPEVPSISRHSSAVPRGLRSFLSVACHLFLGHPASSFRLPQATSWLPRLLVGEGAVTRASAQVFLGRLCVRFSHRMTKFPTRCVVPCLESCKVSIPGFCRGGHEWRLTRTLKAWQLVLSKRHAAAGLRRRTLQEEMTSGNTNQKGMASSGPRAGHGRADQGPAKRRIRQPQSRAASRERTSTARETGLWNAADERSNTLCGRRQEKRGVLLAFTTLKAA